MISIFKNIKEKKELLILFFILGLAAFLRFYKISGYMTFLGDEGRDVLVVKQMIVDRKWTLLGPTASVGGFFLGPFYYYLMIPFLWIFKLNPLGPAVMVAFFGIATVFLVYKVGKDFFDKKVGLLASFFYAISPLVVTYSRASWNPNLMPFFSLLIIWFLWKAARKDSLKLLGLIGFLFGLTLQLHYLATFLMVIAGVYFLIFGRQRKNYKAYIWLLVGFLAGWSPFLLFELRHKFPNFRSLYQFFLYGDETGFNLRNFLPTVWEVMFRVFERLTGTGEKFLGWVLILISLPFFGFSFLKAKQDKKRVEIFALLGFWLFLGVGIFGFYQDNIYDYYFGFMFPLPFLLVSFTLVKLAQINRFGFFVSLFIFLIVSFYSLKKGPYSQSPNYQLRQTKQISKIVYEQINDEPFNFALITGQNSDHAYRYFLELWGAKPVTIEGSWVDPERKTVTDQLLIVCEQLECQPLGHSLWEIAGFGRAEIAGSWPAPGGITVMKLIRFEGENEKIKGKN